MAHKLIREALRQLISNYLSIYITTFLSGSTYTRNPVFAGMLTLVTDWSHCRLWWSWSPSIWDHTPFPFGMVRKRCRWYGGPEGWWGPYSPLPSRRLYINQFAVRLLLLSLVCFTPTVIRLFPRISIYHLSICLTIDLPSIYLTIYLSI